MLTTYVYFLPVGIKFFYRKIHPALTRTFLSIIFVSLFILSLNKHKELRFISYLLPLFTLLITAGI